MDLQHNASKSSRFLFVTGEQMLWGWSSASRGVDEAIPMDDKIEFFGINVRDETLESV
jgi:hypothetical protein